MKKRYPDIMSKARNESVKLAQAAGVEFDGADCTILKPYNPEWIKSSHWEDMIDRVWNTPKWLNKAVSGSQNRNTLKEGSVSKHCAGSITISQHKRKFVRFYLYFHLHFLFFLISVMFSSSFKVLFRILFKSYKKFMNLQEQVHKRPQLPLNYLSSHTRRKEHSLRQNTRELRYLFLLP